MEEALEIEAEEKNGDAVRGRSLDKPKQNWGEKSAAEDDRREIGEEFGGVFQRR